MKLLYICNDRAYFEAHRRSLSQAAVKEGWDVSIACGGMEETAGAPVGDIIPLKVVRHGLNPLKDLRLGLDVLRLCRELRPDVVHLITLKPVLVGGVALRFVRHRPRVVATFPGLGRVFDLRETSFKARLRRFLTLLGLRFGYRPATTRGLFETDADRRELLAAGVLSDRRAFVVAGAGVDEKIFRQRPLPAGPVRILFAARLLRSKGAHILAGAARQLAGAAEFVVAGLPQPDDPDGLSEAEITALAKAPGVRYLGAIAAADMPQQIAEAHAVVLPTAYREGIPRILIEAAAIGRPAIVSANPGCLALITHDVQGLVLNEISPDALVSAAGRLVNERGLLQRLAGAARERFETGGFSTEAVNRESLAVYRD